MKVRNNGVKLFCQRAASTLSAACVGVNSYLVGSGNLGTVHDHCQLFQRHGREPKNIRLGRVKEKEVLCKHAMAKSVSVDIPNSNVDSPLRCLPNLKWTFVPDDVLAYARNCTRTEYTPVNGNSTWESNITSADLPDSYCIHA